MEPAPPAKDAPKPRGFQKGAPNANPGGRPKLLVELERRIREDSADDVIRLLRSIRQRAEDGDMQAAKIWLDRVLGPPRIPPDEVGDNTMRIIVAHEAFAPQEPPHDP